MKPKLNKSVKEKILLGSPYITEDEITAVSKVVKSGQLSLGKETEEFEQTEFQDELNNQDENINETIEPEKLKPTKLPLSQ